MQLFYGRESVDKDRFLADLLGTALTSVGAEGAPKRIVLLVPDQYTLQAERNVFLYLGVRGFMDLEILSQNRLSERVLSETGGSKRVAINKQGRHMLLSKIVNEVEEDLTVFRGLGRSQAFLELTNNFIAELKQYNASPTDLSALLASMEENSLLGRKIKDIATIFSRYEEQIQDRYLDTEDRIELFLSKIGTANFVKESQFFMAGFDSLTPKTIRVLTELERYGQGLSLILTADPDGRDRDLFQLTETLMSRLELTIPTSAPGGKVERKKIQGPMQNRTPALRHLEQELFSFPYQPVQAADRIEQGSIVFCRAANYYAEAETAAKYICTLIREKGLRYRDIAVICNDMDGRGSVIKRVFNEYGISFFLDQKRSILHDPVIVFITSLLSVITEGWRYEDVFQLLKTDLCPISREEYEELENYAIRYKIQGNRWQKEFQYGARDRQEVNLVKLNTIRQILVDFIQPLSIPFKEAKTVREKTKALIDFLVIEADVPGKLEAMTQTLEEEDQYEGAFEMAQIWDGISDLFLQLVELIGDETISNQEYLDLLQTGFASVELGMIPPTVDQVVVGTMQRTRVGRIQALLILGANDGVLPASPAGDDLLSQDERSLLIKQGIEICQDDDRRMMEERLAIYRNLAKPERFLWLGYSASDPEGKELRPSIVFDRLRQIFPGIPLEKDIRSLGDSMALIERAGSSINHLTEAMQSMSAGEELEPTWKAAYNWYKKTGDWRLSLVKSGLTFDNRMERLDRELVQNLFRKKDGEELVLSPSRLEKFGRCPFAHLVLYGLAPEERRVFEVAGREAGDVYHECLMRLSDRLTKEGVGITEPDSPWMSLTRESCDNLVDGILGEIASNYREGMLLAGEMEQYRLDRIKEVCRFAAFAMVEHVQQGQIKTVYFEEGFGSGRDQLLPPIRVSVGDHDVLIEGKIDRVDVLPDGFVKIIDYKSGIEHFDAKEAKAGWRLQLMLYLKAVVDGFQNRGNEAKPAGVFYFQISDPIVDASTMSDQELQGKVALELRRAFRLDGIVVDDPAVIDNIAGEFSGYSDILPIYKNKDGVVTGNSDQKLVSVSDFEELRWAVDQTIQALCTSLEGGVIDAHPKKTKYETACTYCIYKSICNFDLSFDGCSYDVVK